MEKRIQISCELFLNQILTSNPFEDLALLSKGELEQKSIVEMEQCPKQAVNTSQWSIEQNKIYLKYLNDYKGDFFNEKIRRKSKVYKRMSEEMGNKRTPQQCRGHHKKMLNRCQTIQSIIKSIRSKIKKSAIKKKHRETENTQQGVFSFEQITFQDPQMVDKMPNILQKSNQTLFSSLSDLEQNSSEKAFELLIKC